MHYLLDTCTFVWLVNDPPQLSAVARAAVEDTNNTLHLSAISISEIHRLIRKGKIAIQAPQGLEHWFRLAFAQLGIVPEPITWEIAHLAETLPPIHNDPADRFIVATAQRLNAPIITPDKIIPSYSGTQVAW